MWNSLNALEPHSMDSLGHQHHTKNQVSKSHFALKCCAKVNQCYQQIVFTSLLGFPSGPFHLKQFKKNSILAFDTISASRQLLNITLFMDFRALCKDLKPGIIKKANTMTLLKNKAAFFFFKELLVFWHTQTSLLKCRMFDFKKVLLMWQLTEGKSTKL